jgi:hypothetical protein
MTTRQYVPLLLLALLGGMAGGLLGTEVIRGSKVVTAREFRVVDWTGKVRASLSFSPGPGRQSGEGVTSLRLFDEKGASRVELSWREGQPRPGGFVETSQLALRDKSGIARSIVQFDETDYFGNASLTLNDSAGKVLWLHPASVLLSGEGAGVRVASQDQRLDAELLVSPDDHRPRLRFIKKDGLEQLPSLLVVDSAGKVLWSAP